MSRWLRFIASGLLAVVVLATAFITHYFARTYEGVSPQMWLSSFAPLVLFGGALVLARSKVGGLCTVGLLALVTAWTVLAAYDVFRATARGEVIDLIGFTLGTWVETLLSVVVLVVALVDWLVHRFKEAAAGGHGRSSSSARTEASAWCRLSRCTPGFGPTGSTPGQWGHTGRF